MTQEEIINAARWARYARAARKHAGLTTPDLADALGVNRSTPWRWEAGQNVPESVPLVARFAEVTGVNSHEALTAAGLHADPRPAVELPEPAPHPLARQLDQLIGAESPLDGETKKGLEKVVEALLRTYPDNRPPLNHDVDAELDCLRPNHPPAQD